MRFTGSTRLTEINKRIQKVEEGVGQQVQEYLNENPPNITPGQIGEAVTDYFILNPVASNSPYSSSWNNDTDAPTKNVLYDKIETVVNHNHDSVYSPLGHGHGSDYAPYTHSHSEYELADLNIQAHIGSAHAPSNAQKNSDITKGEIEAKLIGEISTHTHAGGAGVTHSKMISYLSLRL